MTDLCQLTPITRILRPAYLKVNRSQVEEGGPVKKNTCFVLLESWVLTEKGVVRSGQEWVLGDVLIFFSRFIKRIGHCCCFYAVLQRFS